MNNSELIAIFRDESGDVEQPYVWSDALLHTYVNDAQKQFCRLTYGIEDGRSFVLNIQPNMIWYEIDPLITKLRDAINPATGRSVPMIAVEKMAENSLAFDNTVGPLKALITGIEKNYVRALPTPSVASVVELRTFRLPFDMTVGGSFEIDDQHVLNLLYWVKYRAYSIQDPDARDEKKAALCKAEFEAYCAKAKVEQSRIRRPVSTVTYGGL